MVKRILRRLKPLLNVLAKPFKWIWRKLRKPKVARVTAAVVSPPVTWGVTALIVGGSAASLMVIQIMAHEYAHYFMARMTHADVVWLPFLVPVIIGALGRTYVKDPNPKKHRKIAAAGPIVGVTLAVIWFVVGWWFDIPILLAAGVIFGVIEMINAFVGFDGRKFRAAGRQIRLAEGGSS